VVRAVVVLEINRSGYVVVMSSSVKLIGVVMVVSSEVLNLALFSKFAKVTPFDNWGC